MNTEIIAEIAQGYEGDPKLAELLVKGALVAGADAVKIQIIFADELCVPDYPYYDLFKSLEMDESVWQGLVSLVKKENKKISRGAASGGFKLAGDILASGLCKRVDLYGYSSEGAGKYFNLGKTMSSIHLMGLENFIYRVAQEQEMMCVYD